MFEASPARPSKRMPRPRAVLAALACTLVLGVTACSPADADEPAASPDSPSVPATDEPIFASDEEALAAAVEAYEAYAAMSATISAEGGENPDRIRDLVSEELAGTYIREFQSIAEANIRSRGEARIFGARLAERSDSAVSIYLCRDYTNVRIFDAEGNDITSPDRPPLSASLASFEPANNGSDKLILTGSEEWDDTSFCE